jgi:hypothetical protein
MKKKTRGNATILLAGCSKKNVKKIAIKKKENF